MKEAAVVEKERMKRPDPERTRPIRMMGGYVHRPSESPPSGRGPAGNSGKPSARADKVISDTVKLAYDLAEEQIDQGRFAAERVRDGSYNAADFDEDVRAQVDRLLRVSKDLGVQWFEILNGILKASAGATKTARPAPPVTLSIEVKSSRRAQVTVDIWPTTGRFVPLALPLHNDDADVPPLTNVRLVIDETTRPVLVVEIPNDQPAGVYSGVVVDADTRQPAGVVSVRVQE
jgi:hypothetical protein